MAVTAAELKRVAVVEVMETHVNCRCTLVPRAKSYADLLGDPSIPDERPDLGTGPETFAKLPPSIQAEILGPGKFALYQRGVPLEAMYRRSESAEWGASRVGKSLRQLREEIAAGMWPILPELVKPSDPRLALFEEVRGYVSQRTIHPNTRSYWQALSSEQRAEGLRNLQLTVDNGTLNLRRSMEASLKIIEEGRFKTQFETTTSSGVYDPSWRAAAEQEMFGYVGLDPKLRPVYGYVLAEGANEDGSGNWEWSGASSYGAVRFELRDYVRQYTTVVWTDSLSAPEHPVPIDGITESAYVGAADFHPPAYPAPGRPYIEAQYHGGLSIADIERVAFHWTQGYENAAVNDELRAALRAAGFDFEARYPDKEYETWSRP